MLGLLFIAGSSLASADENGEYTEEEGNSDLHEIDEVILANEYPSHSVFGGGIYYLYWRAENDVIYIAIVGKTASWIANC